MRQNENKKSKLSHFSGTIFINLNGPHWLNKVYLLILNSEKNFLALPHLKGFAHRGSCSLISCKHEIVSDRVIV